MLIISSMKQMFFCVVEILKIVSNLPEPIVTKSKP